MLFRSLIKEKEEAEELVEEAEEATPEEDETVDPQEITTSADVLDGKMASIFKEAVKGNLVRFHSVGNKS